MFTDLRKKIRLLQPERRKNRHLRKAFRQLQEISKTSFDYYSEVYRTQKIVENLYDVERKRSVTMHGILSALEILIDKKLSFNDQMDKILKILIKTTKGDRSFLFKTCIGFDDCMELVNYSGEFDVLYEDNKSTFIKYPGFHEYGKKVIHGYEFRCKIPGRFNKQIIYVKVHLIGPNKTVGPPSNTVRIVVE